MQSKHRRLAYCCAAEPGSTAAGSRLSSGTCSSHSRGSLRVNLTAAAAAVCLLSAAGAQAATYGLASVLQYHKNPSKDGYYINSDLKGGLTIRVCRLAHSCGVRAGHPLQGARCS